LCTVAKGYADERSDATTVAMKYNCREQKKVYQIYKHPQRWYCKCVEAALYYFCVNFIIYIYPMRKTVIATTCCLVLIACNLNKNTALTKEEVIAVIEKFDDGWNKKNLAKVDATLAPSYTYFTQSGGIFSRDSVVATAGSPDYFLEKVSRTDYEVAIDGNTAIVSTRWTGKGTYRGYPFNENQRCSITVIKKEGRVQILSEHCTPIKSIRIFH
jgi:Domain of unknown function (DUF4440)